MSKRIDEVNAEDAARAVRDEEETAGEQTGAAQLPEDEE